MSEPDTWTFRTLLSRMRPVRREPETKHLHLGAEGEERCVALLRRKGFRILARNWRPPAPDNRLELDVIARDGDTVVFVEVKTRQAPEGGRCAVPPESAFTPAKKMRLVRAAELWLSARGERESPCRFDLVCAEKTPDGSFHLEHYPHVVELGNVVDNGHASW